VFAYLAAQNGRPVPRDELAELLWGDELPPTWEKALRVLMTKLRALLEECGIDGSSALSAAFGCYQLMLPEGTWIDIDVGAKALEHAEAALAQGDFEEARSQASTAVALARRSFLPGEDGSWVEEQRRELGNILVRALECLRDGALAAGDSGEAVRLAAEITELEPFRESSYRALMQAHAAAGNPAEALRVYERCRRFLADELGTYPSAETEAVYLEILRSSPKGSVAEVDHLPPPSVAAAERPRRKYRKLASAVIVGAVLVAAAVVAALVLTRGEDAPPAVLPTSLVRLDPNTLEPKQVVPIGPRADFVVVSGGYVWVTHGILRHASDAGLRNAGDRMLTRVDPETGEARPVGGGLAPCGITADPSGDVWVANCYASGSSANIVRVDARTLEFERPFVLPTGPDFLRGTAYGGGSLWVGGGEAGSGEVTEFEPETRARRAIELEAPPTLLAWSEGYGDLWMDDFDAGSVSRMHAETSEVLTFNSVVASPGVLVVQGDAVWVGEWSNPRVVRLSAVGSKPPRRIRLPVTTTLPTGVTGITAGAGSIWAAVPENRALFRIDPKTNSATRIPFPYRPWGVAVGDDGVWVTMRAEG
jgi:DNA-binding SARP family transcriptional activator/streptogramin lyase